MMRYTRARASARIRAVFPPRRTALPFSFFLLETQLRFYDMLSAGAPSPFSKDTRALIVTGGIFSGCLNMGLTICSNKQTTYCTVVPPPPIRLAPRSGIKSTLTTCRRSSRDQLFRSHCRHLLLTPRLVYICRIRERILAYNYDSVCICISCSHRRHAYDHVSDRMIRERIQSE